MSAILILTTVPDDRLAKSLAKSLVKQKLAACVSISGSLISYYEWKRRIERASEKLVLIKTTAKNFKSVEAFIRSVHPYEVPEIVGIPISKISNPYDSWLKKIVS